MRGALLAAAGTCALALAIAAHGPPATSSTFDATAVNSGNTFAAAVVNAAPDVSAAVIGKSAGGAVGAVKRGGTFYVYASATDDVRVASVTAKVTNVTGSATSVPLTAGSYTAGGVSYGYRSAQLTALSSLTAGAKAFTVTATDAGALTDVFTGSVTADITAPSATAIATTNKAGGVAGKAEQGDTLAVTYSEAIDPQSMIAGWDGSAIDRQVAIVDGGYGQDDYLRVYPEGTIDPSTYLPVGIIDLGRADFVTTGTYAVFGLTGGATASTISMSGTRMTITLGSLDYGTSNTTASYAIERYTPLASMFDLAGNASGTSTISATGSHRVF